MPSTRLTRRNIDAIVPPASGQVFYRDADLAGFGLRVGTTSKTFFAEGQVRRRTIRVTIGKYELIDPDAARKRARKLLGEMAEGRDPNGEKRARGAMAMTLQEAFDSFFDGRRLSPTSVPNYQRTVRIYLKDWASKPIADVSRRMVLERHRLIGERNGPVTANNVMRHLRSVYNYTSAAHGDG